MEGYIPNYKKKYVDEVRPALMKKQNYKTIMQVPRLEKIVVNQGLGEALNDKKFIEKGLEELTAITGQKAVPTVSKRDISNFKLRKGRKIGVKVNLRGNRMYEFLERLISTAIPRIKDFNGLHTKFDGHGNYTLGIQEQIIFPEIEIEKVFKLKGLNITFVTNTDSDEEAFNLFKEYGFPFKKN
ncbi:MAG: 50S ribosomal protein L5 [Bacteroidota bacterium]|nr:50S ribosomal protein L5 [Bacteroidota bacterium]